MKKLFFIFANPSTEQEASRYVACSVAVEVLPGISRGWRFLLLGLN
jgi:hypothetical protein